MLKNRIENRKPYWNANSIKSLRKTLKMSQSDFSKKLGIRQQTVSEWETGAYLPRGGSLTLLNMIAENIEANLFDKNENHSFSSSENIFKSKEEFINYVKDIFKATFKVTKYEDHEYLIENRNPENIKKISLSAKEFLLLDNLNESISILEDSEINNSQFEEWLFEANKIKQANSNFRDLEQQILQLLGKSFD